MEDAPSQPVGRRGLIGGLAVGTVALGAGAAGGFAASRRSVGWRRTTLDLEVACLADTMRVAKPDDVTDEADFRGAFLVEGLFYPPGTIKGDGFIPTRDGAIGQWFCRGWFVNSAARPEPHISSNQEYVFSLLTPERKFARDNLSSAGLEGTDTRDELFHRGVTGGTGRYLGATGEQTQSFFAENSSQFPDGGAGPCFRIHFDLLLPD